MPILELLLVALTVVTGIALGITLVIYTLKYPFEKTLPGRIIFGGGLSLLAMVSVGLIRRAGSHELADVAAIGSYVLLAGVLIMALRMLLSHAARKKPQPPQESEEMEEAPRGQTLLEPISLTPKRKESYGERFHS